MAGWIYNRHLSFDDMLRLPYRLVQGFQICEAELPAIHAELSEEARKHG